VLTRFELGEDVDKFADATIRQRLAGIYQRFVVGNPGLSLGHSLTSADITNPTMQCSFATAQTLHAQDSLVHTLNRYPNTDELYAQWPKNPGLPGTAFSVHWTIREPSFFLPRRPAWTKDRS
jgi:hypothetical protein